MTPVILACLVTALVATFSGYYISYRFHRSNYAATNTSGDFGAPRGGFLAAGAGMIIGMYFAVYGAKYLFGAEVVGPAMLTGMLTGLVGGISGVVRAVKGRLKGSNDDDANKGS